LTGESLKEQQKQAKANKEEHRMQVRNSSLWNALQNSAECS